MDEYRKHVGFFYTFIDLTRYTDIRIYYQRTKFTEKRL